MFAQVDEVEDVFLKTGSPETNRGFEELRADPAIGADGVGHLVDIGFGGFAEGGDRIDGGDPLGQKGVGRELGKLGGPEVGGQNLLLRHPGRVDIDELLDRGLAFGRLVATDQDPVRIFEILDGGALGQELGIGKNLKFAPFGIGFEDALDRFGRAHRQGGFFHHDLVVLTHFGDLAGTLLDIAEVGCPAGTDAVGLGRRVDRDEDHVRLADGRIHIGREKEIFAATGPHDFIEARLVNRQFLRIPGVDPRLIDIDDSHAMIRALVRDHRHRRPADVSGSYAANFHDSPVLQDGALQTSEFYRVNPSPSKAERISRNSPLSSISSKGLLEEIRTKSWSWPRSRPI